MSLGGHLGLFACMIILLYFCRPRSGPAELLSPCIPVLLWRQSPHPRSLEDSGSTTVTAAELARPDHLLTVAVHGGYTCRILRSRRRGDAAVGLVDCRRPSSFSGSFVYWGET
jgi:hypothetical protein